MTDSPRITRPIPDRTHPRRGAMGALNQHDPMADAATGGHPLGPGFAAAGDATAAAHAAFDKIDEGVRAASDIVDAHIRQGEETAKALGRGEPSQSLGQGDLSGIITGLVRAYSDVASVWVDVVGALAARIEGAGGQAAATPTSPVPTQAFGFRIATATPVAAQVEMFRPADAVKAQPLVASTADGPAQITDVRFEPSGAGAAGLIAIQVPNGQAPGLYNGVLLHEADNTPVGVVTLTVMAEGT